MHTYTHKHRVHQCVSRRGNQLDAGADLTSMGERGRLWWFGRTQTEGFLPTLQILVQVLSTNRTESQVFHWE